ncbi:hypothetical protein NMG60_11031680 [Bertholletia excelsa]
MVVAAAPSISMGSSHCQFCHVEASGCFTSYAVASSWIKSPHEGELRFIIELSEIAENSVSLYTSVTDFGFSFLMSYYLYPLRYRGPLFGTTQLHWLHVGREICQSKVPVAADYSDSVPDSPIMYGCKRVRDTQLTPPEVARTTVEAHSSALLIFPSVTHREPHEYISWAEFPYVIDEYGDIFFQIFDDENILQDRGASNLVNVLVGMDIKTYENRRAAAAEYDISDMTDSDDIPSSDDGFEVEDDEMPDISIEWGMPTDNVNEVHPIYFSKCLVKAVKQEYAKMMDYPSNGVSIVGFLRPALMSEELYLRRLFIGEDSDEYASDWKDGEAWDFRHEGYGNRTSSTIYRLEIMRIELFSIYGIQACIIALTIITFEYLTYNYISMRAGFGAVVRGILKLKDFFFSWNKNPEILRPRFFSPYLYLLNHPKLFFHSALSTIDLQDFQEAEPDVLVHCNSTIIGRLSENGMRCNIALKALCKRKGLYVEDANLIGVDSLGMDVRIFTGIEVQTYRFPFKVRATSEGAAEKQINRLLFPRTRQKKFKMHADGFRDLDKF